MALWHPYYYDPFSLVIHRRPHNHLPLADHLFDAFDSMFEVPSQWLADMTRDRPLDAGRTTEIANTEDQFKINLNVEDFKPEELDVKLVRDRFVVISGKKEQEISREQEGEKGLVHHEFTRSFVVPKGVDVSKLRSNLTKNGILTIEAPKMDVPQVKHERTIAIEQVEPPAQIKGQQQQGQAQIQNQK